MLDSFTVFAQIDAAMCNRGMLTALVAAWLCQQSSKETQQAFVQTARGTALLMIDKQLFKAELLEEEDDVAEGHGGGAFETPSRPHLSALLSDIDSAVETVASSELLTVQRERERMSEAEAQLLHENHMRTPLLHNSGSTTAKAPALSYEWSPPAHDTEPHASAQGIGKRPSGLKAIVKEPFRWHSLHNVDKLHRLIVYVLVFKLLFILVIALLVLIGRCCWPTPSLKEEQLYSADRSDLHEAWLPVLAEIKPRYAQDQTPRPAAHVDHRSRHASTSSRTVPKSDSKATNADAGRGVAKSSLEREAEHFEDAMEHDLAAGVKKIKDELKEVEAFEKEVEEEGLTREVGKELNKASRSLERDWKSFRRAVFSS